MQTISPQKARELLDQGAVLVDIREPDEHRRERIDGALNHALSNLDGLVPVGDGDRVMIYHCRSGGRTTASADRLAEAAACDAYILDGGIEAWKKAGLPVVKDRGQPIEVMRQVQIAAGSLTLLGVILGFLVHPGFFGLSAFVGAGLTFAGATGWCGMALLLRRMPWNQVARRAVGGPATA